MITITINSVDRSDDISRESVNLSQTLSKEPATLSFSIIGNKTQPSLGQSIVLTEDSEDIFSGTIVERHEEAQGGVMVLYSYVALDGYYQLDRKLVSAAYTDTDAVALVQDILDNYVTGITLSAPVTSPSIKTARFNYLNPSQCIQQIANQVGWDWYIDASNVLHFFPPDTITAPFDIEDNNDTVIAGSLAFDSNITELKNIMYVRGGEYLDPIDEADAIDKYSADGDQVAFPLVYRYNSIQVKKNGVAQTVGVDFLNDPADYDCLYNFQEKLIRFREDNKPSVGQVVKVWGNAYVPLIVQAVDSDSIVAYGEKEGVQIDTTITSIEEAELLANSLLEKWRSGSQEGSFATRETGLRVGQSISINSSRFGVNTSYKVNRISGTIDYDGAFLYKVQFITSGQTTFTDILIGLVGKDRKNVQISPDEVIQVFRQIDDLFSMSDEIVSVTTTSPPYKYGPTTGTVGKYNFSTYS